MLYNIIYLLYAFALQGMYDKPDDDQNRLNLFKEKVIVFCENCHCQKKEMPNSMKNQGKSQFEEMPSPNIEGFMVHRETGLHYYPIEAVLVDEATKFSYDLNSYVIIDMKNNAVVGSDKPLCELASENEKSKKPSPAARL